MITIREIREVARTFGVPESTIERDYAQNWFLGTLFTFWDELILKGGTGIRKVYIEGYRFSDDLDFTILGDVDEKSVKDLISKVVVKTKEESGIDFDERISIKENINGFEGKVYFRLLRRIGTPIGIKLDFTKPDMEKVVLSPLKKRIIHPYSDDRGFDVMVYPLEEIMGEKIRSLFERTRPRDLYDVWYFCDKVNLDDVLEIFVKNCQFKDMKPDSYSFLKRKDDFKNAWENSLGHQLKELPDFDETYENVSIILKRLL
ncbi:MAG: nucleotidyl transferase AbiEii/AbiGii toxin family protein [Methanomassiliicoccales archaeon]|nr:MAG: nucleotidyl transferase AbiEii/AbiGii toxin family protein [Methanomassiliicoccales archaeon]